MAARRRFVTLDVFTDTPLAGNPLAVVLDGEGLESGAMRAIAREFNLSETVFVLPAENSRQRARLRIFTPLGELPFAGHPTVGTAVLLALRDRDARPAGSVDAVAFGLEERIGVVPCIVETGEGRGYARFRVPSLPAFLGEGLTSERLAPLVGLDPADLGFARHAPSRHAAGPAFTFVPVGTVERLDAARLDADAFARAHAAGHVDALYLYAQDPDPPDGADRGHRYQARMFAPHLGVAEDPATGSAAAAFAGAMMQFEQLGDGTHDIVIRQGLAMGRPSTIALQLAIESGVLRSVEIGGAAVIASEGHLLV